MLVTSYLTLTSRQLVLLLLGPDLIKPGPIHGSIAWAELDATATLFFKLEVAV